jgi:hypothetical protein
VLKPRGTRHLEDTKNQLQAVNDRFLDIAAVRVRHGFCHQIKRAVGERVTAGPKRNRREEAANLSKAKGRCSG